MKKLFLFIIAFTAASAVQAQSVWGVRAGVDFTNYNLSLQGVSARINPGTKSGFIVGVVNNKELTSRLDLQSELMYNYNGARLHISSDVSSELFVGPQNLPVGKLGMGLGFHTLRLPAMIKFRPAGRLSIMAGPYLALRVGMGLRFNKDFQKQFGLNDEEFILVKDTYKDFFNDSIRKFDIGVVMGIEYAFKNGVFVDARYSVSLLNSLARKGSQQSANQYINPRLRYSSIQLGCGYRF